MQAGRCDPTTHNDAYPALKRPPQYREITGAAISSVSLSALRGVADFRMPYLLLAMGRSQQLSLGS